ncbi:MAG: DUF2029 domain-containing protein [Solirubrobacterales bacterium]|nr:DUF2029 domain-containing protein [Solirubrobacterales bacterium]
MSRRDRIITALVACAINLALLVPTVGDTSTLIDGDFGPEGIAIENGAKPYADQDFEYPPLAVPLIVGPALIGDGESSYRDAFEWEMIAFSLAIVLTLALAMQGPRERVWGALGVYTLGILALSGIVLPDSDIEQAPLALARFDLALALLVLAAVLAREAKRSATWSFLLSLGVAVKGFPAALYPALLREEGNLKRVVLGALPPLLAAVALVVLLGDEFGSAITYHSGRDLQIETVAATPFEVGHLFGLRAESVTGAGSFNLDATGADAARALSLGLMVAGYFWLLWEGWRRQAPRPQLALALLAVIVVLAPVLSPQFLIWLLPLSAAVYGLGKENVVLLGACAVTQLMLHAYDIAIDDLGAAFTVPTAIRNLLLLVYLYLVSKPIFDRQPLPSGEWMPGKASSS